MFDQCLQQRKNKLLSSQQRAWGKTTILNEIGFTYQALGYDVLLVTTHSESNEHIATMYFDYVFTKARLLADYGKTIVIVDEYDYCDLNFQEIMEFFDKKKIPYVGFVRFD